MLRRHGDFALRQSQVFLAVVWSAALLSLPFAASLPALHAASSPASGAAPSRVVGPRLATVGPIRVGANPRGIALDATTDTIYVVNSNDGTVSVIDGATNSVSATIMVGSNPFAIAVDETTHMIYVANLDTNNLSIIDGTANTVTTIPVGVHPEGIAVDETTHTIYVACQTDTNGATIPSVWVIAGQTRTVTTSLPVGNNPYAIGVDAVTHRVYVANEFSNSVSVIDSTTNTVTTTITGLPSNPYSIAVDLATDTVDVVSDGGATIAVIDGPANSIKTTIGLGPQAQTLAIALDSSTGVVYASDSGTNCVDVVGAASNKLIATLAVGQHPWAIAADPLTQTIYVTNSADNTVSAINGVNPLPRTVEVGSGPIGIAVDAAANTIYTANVNSNTASAISGLTDSVIPIPVDTNPGGVAADAATNKVYVTNFSSSTISIIDGSRDVVADRISLGGGHPGGIAVDATTDTLYVTNNVSGANSIWVINGATKAIITTVAVGALPDAVAVDEATRTIYVSNLGDGTVSIVDGTSNTVTGSIPVGGAPQRVAVNPATNTLYVTTGNTVAVIDAATRAMTTTVPIGAAAAGVAVDATHNLIYADSSAANTVSIIDGATNQVIETFAVGSNPSDIAVDAATDTVYVSNHNDSTVSVIPTATPPRAPQILSTTPGDGSATIHWQAPASSGGSPITNYAVTPNPATVPAVFVAGTASTAVVSGLTNGTSYTFTVTALNGLGSGIASAPSGPVTPLGPVSPSTSTVLANPESVVADGLGNAHITVTLLDGAGDPIPGKSLALAGSSAKATLTCAASPCITNPSGQAQFVSGDTTAELVTYSATDLSDHSLLLTQKATVTFTPGPVSATLSTLQADPASVPADGISVATVSVTLVDANQNPVPGKRVSIAGSSGTHSLVSPQGATTDGAGQATFALRDGTVEAVTYTATDTSDSGLTLSQTATVTFGPRPADAAASSLRASPVSVPADGSTQATISVVLDDDAGNPVADKTVGIVASGGASLVTAVNATTDSKGRASFTATDRTAEVVTYTAIDSSDAVTLSHAVTVAFTLACGSCTLSFPLPGAAAPLGQGVHAMLRVQPPSQGLSAWAVTVDFDPTQLQFSGCGASPSACSSATLGQVMITGSAATPLQGLQTLASLSFQTVGSVGASTGVSATVLKLVDPGGTPFSGSGADLLVVVGSQGDVNLDGSVTSVDALCVLRFVAALPQSTACPQTPATKVMADVNGDGTITSLDALCALRLVAALPPMNACPSGVSGASSSVSRAVAPSLQPLSGSPPSLGGQGAGGLADALSIEEIPGDQRNAATVQVLFDASAHSEPAEGLIPRDSRSLGAWTIDLHYDSSTRQVVGCEPLDGSVCNVSFAPGVVRLSGAAASGLPRNQALATLHLSGGRNAGHLGEEIRLTAVTLTGADGTPLQPLR